LTEALAWPPPAPPAILFILTGPSGAGKDTVRDALRHRLPELHYTVTATTRPPREYERDGEHYHFLSLERFLALRDAQELLEWEEVYTGTWYGTPRAEVEEPLARGQDVIARVDVGGARSLKARYPEAVTILLGPGTLGELAGRLHKPGVERDRREERLAKAQAELALYPQFDYVVLNRDNALAEAVDAVAAIIAAERLRVSRRMATRTVSGSLRAWPANRSLLVNTSPEGGPHDGE
jgi:guanylate kinase